MKKKLVLLLSVVLVMCSLLCACGGEKSQFVGEWIADNRIDKETYELEDVASQYTFKKDGTGYYKQSGAILQITWEVIDENTIIVYTETQGKELKLIDDMLINDTNYFYVEYSKK